MELEIELDEPIDEKKAEAGGKMAPGWYLAKVFDIFADPANPAMKIEYEVTAGPYAGKKVNDTLWDPDASEDQEKAKAARSRLKLVALRIGAAEDGSTSIKFVKAVGNPVVLHLVRQQERKCETCGEKPAPRIRKCASCGGKVVYLDIPDGFVNPAYDGVYPLDHDKIPDEVRAALGITVAKRVPREVAKAREDTDRQADAVFGGGGGGGQGSNGTNGHAAPAPPAMDKQARLEKELAGF